ncbi:hypothetical protein [Flavobacterium sp.]|uniref:hypothetical protein n=1 Tax=Flavobacterium sp. TaxID=239 RepID=UPI00374D88F1
MKITSKILLIVLVILNLNLVEAQEKENFENLIVNQWVLEKYEQNGEVSLPKGKHQNDTMIFYKNHKVKSISCNATQKGIWEYNSENQTITMFDKKNNLKMPLKIIKISNYECIVEFDDAKGEKRKMFLKSLPKN